MKDKDLVCFCEDIKVEDIKEVAKQEGFNELSKEEKIEKMKIGTLCRCCLVKSCRRINVHYSEIID